MKDSLNLMENYESTITLNDEDLLDDLKESIMLAIKDTDGDTAYQCMLDIIADLDVLKTRLERTSTLEEQSARYFKWWREDGEKIKKLKKKLFDIAGSDDVD